MIDQSELSEQDLREFLTNFIQGTKQDIVETAKCLPFIDYLEVTVNLIMGINVSGLADKIDNISYQKLINLQTAAIDLVVPESEDLKHNKNKPDKTEHIQ